MECLLQYRGWDSEGDRSDDDSSQSSEAAAASVKPRDRLGAPPDRDRYGLVGAVQPDDGRRELADADKDTDPPYIDIGGQKISLPDGDFWKDISLDHISDVMVGGGADVARTRRRRREGPSRKSGSRKWGLGECASGTIEPATQVRRSRLAPAAKPASRGADGGTGRRNLYFLHGKVAPLLHSGFVKNRIPRSACRNFCAHQGAVNRINWCCPQFSHLLLSASMDSTVKVWNVWSQLADPCARTLQFHTKAVKSAVWSSCGRRILSCSFDKRAAISDVETGTPVQMYAHESYVTCGKFYPENEKMLITGSSGTILCWDSRTPAAAVRSYIFKDNIGTIQDLLFSHNGTEFFSSSDLVSRDSADRNIMAWDFRSGVILSNQIYHEKYTCPRLKLHPNEGHFLAQSQGGYIAQFSTNRPYKMNKAKRFESHKILGYNIGFDISLDGSQVVTGSSDGQIHIYFYGTGKKLKTLNTELDISMDVVCHPVLPSTYACCGWNRQIQIWQ